MTTSPAVGTVPQWTVGDRLRKAREIAGMDVQDFAKELGISRNSVTKYEHSDTQPRSVVLLAWALRTGVNPEWLRTGALPFDPAAQPEDLAAAVPAVDDSVRRQGLEPRTRWLNDHTGTLTPTTPLPGGLPLDPAA